MSTPAIDMILRGVDFSFDLEHRAFERRVRATPHAAIAKR
jgi:hypothetical protein